MVRVLFSLMFGKEYVSVEWEAENKYEISGKRLTDLLDMIDHGEINRSGKPAVGGDRLRQKRGRSCRRSFLSASIWEKIRLSPAERLLEGRGAGGTESRIKTGRLRSSDRYYGVKGKKET